LSKTKKKVDQFNHYKRWTTDQGYTFLAENLADAIKYIEKIGAHLGTLKEVKTLD
jgi:hypothetical protein